MMAGPGHTVYTYESRVFFHLFIYYRDGLLFWVLTVGSSMYIVWGFVRVLTATAPSTTELSRWHNASKVVPVHKIAGRGSSWRMRFRIGTSGRCGRYILGSTDRASKTHEVGRGNCVTYSLPLQ